MHWMHLLAIHLKPKLHDGWNASTPIVYISTLAQTKPGGTWLNDMWKQFDVVGIQCES